MRSSQVRLAADLVALVLLLGFAPVAYADRYGMCEPPDDCGSRDIFGALLLLAGAVAVSFLSRALPNLVALILFEAGPVYLTYGLYRQTHSVVMCIIAFVGIQVPVLWLIAMRDDGMGDGAMHVAGLFPRKSTVVSPPEVEVSEGPPIKAPAGSFTGKASQLAGTGGNAALKPLCDALPTTPGFVVVSGESRIRYLIVHGENVRAAFDAFIAFAGSSFDSDEAWLNFTSHGFSGPSVVRVVEAPVSGIESLHAEQEVQRLNRAKPGCAVIWPAV